MTTLRFVAALFFVVGVTMACAGGSEDVSGSLLQGVPTSDIDGSINSMKLEAAPSDANPAIDAREASQLATNAAHYGEILETVLVNYTDLVKEPATPVLAWVVNFKPSPENAAPPLGCGSNCPTEIVTIYDFVLIDAQTGAFLTAANVSGPAP
jgi:hypothetical protein